MRAAVFGGILLSTAAASCSAGGGLEAVGKTSQAATAAEYAYGFDATGLVQQVARDGASTGVVRETNAIHAGASQYALDATGRVIQRNDTQFRYGPSGQIEDASGGGVNAQYAYDEEGHRLSKSSGGAPALALLEEGVLDGAGLTQPITFAGHLAGLLAHGSFQAVAADSRGTVQSGEVASPFGARATHPGGAAAVDYANCPWDSDLQTVRMGVRDYDPALGQFLTPDPLFLAEPERAAESPMESNLYGYAKANPVAYVDPTGKEANASELEPPPAGVDQPRWILHPAVGGGAPVNIQTKQEQYANAFRDEYDGNIFFRQQVKQLQGGGLQGFSLMDGRSTGEAVHWEVDPSRARPFVPDVGGVFLSLPQLEQMRRGLFVDLRIAIAHEVAHMWSDWLNQKPGGRLEQSDAKWAVPFENLSRRERGIELRPESHSYPGMGKGTF